MPGILSHHSTNNKHTMKTPESKHLRHQAMLEQHKEDKQTRRLRHKQGWHKGGHKASGFPVVLV